MTDSLILVDGSSYLYRAFHALPPLTNSKGHPTGAAYGVINMLRKIISGMQPKYIAVIFDAKGKTFRNDMYPEYKANRPPMPDELQLQIEPLYEIIKGMGLPLLVIPGVEADDVIGTLALQATEQKIRTIVSTGDKDMAQLVNEHVHLVNTMTNKYFDEQGILEKYGVTPNQIVDYLSLMGDKVDNVPGVNKVGPKTAVKWLTEYKTLDNIVADADKFKGKVGEYLREACEFLPLSKQLVTIKTDVQLPMNISDLVVQPQDKDILIKNYTELEFKSWLKEQLGSKTNKINSDKINAKQYETILNKNQFDKWLTKLAKAELIAIDTETTSLDAQQAKLVGISFCVDESDAAYLPLAHDYQDAPEQLDKNTVLQALKPILENPNIAKLGHNLKYDFTIFNNEQISLQGIAFDSMLESYVLNSSGSRHNLDTLCLKYLGHNNITFEEVAGSGAKQKTFNEVDINIATPYAAEDAVMSLKLHNILWSKLNEIPELTTVFTQIEMPLLPILALMEQTGVLIDVDLLNLQSEELAKRLESLTSQAYKLADCEFNLDSPKQLQEILYEKNGLPILAKTPKGQPSTAESVLQELALQYDLPAIIIEYRSLNKLKTTYTDKLPQMINPKTSRVHTSYHQAVTITGRLSSSNPNLQNIPIRTEQGAKVRQAFIVPVGYKMISADYSQIELRIMAHLSQDETLLAAFANDHDIHTSTASDVFGVAIDDVTSEQRRSAKAINFGLIYGMSAFGLSKQLQIERSQAQAYIDLYFQRYPGVKDYMEQTRAKAQKQGYVETIFGRRLYLPEINTSNHIRKMAAMRTAINAPMQGSSADIIKKAMFAVDNYLNANYPQAKMLMQVHDELIFEVPVANVEHVASKICQLMENCVNLSVPLKVSVGIGDNWDQAH